MNSTILTTTVGGRNIVGTNSDGWGSLEEPAAGVAKPSKITATDLSDTALADSLSSIQTGTDSTWSRTVNDGLAAVAGGKGYDKTTITIFVILVALSTFVFLAGIIYYLV